MAIGALVVVVVAFGEVGFEVGGGDPGAGELGIGVIADEAGECGGVDAGGVVGFGGEGGENGEVEDLALGEEACAEGGVGEGLDGCAGVVFGGECGSDAGALAEDHPSGFDTDGGDGDVGAGECDRDDEVFTFFGEG